MNNLTDWRSDEAFPSCPLNGYSMQVGKRSIPVTKEKLQTIVLSWQPLSRTLIGTKDSKRMLPPICVQEFQTSCAQGYHKRVKLSLLILACFIAFSLFQSFRMSFQGTATSMLFISMLLFTQVAIDEFKFLSKLSDLSDRGRYFAWKLNLPSAIAAFWFVIIFVGILGLLQFLLELKLGGFEQIVSTFGVVYSKLDNFELWRLLTGPLIHVSTAHLLGNGAMAAIIAPFVFIYMKKFSLLIFFTGYVIGTWAQYILSPFGSGLVGLSAGVFSLYGAAFTLAFWNRNAFPSGLWIQILFAGGCSMIFSSLLNPATGDISHFAGFIFGSIASGTYSYISTKKQILHLD